MDLSASLEVVKPGAYLVFVEARGARNHRG
jgi:hypothetical protein